ncbi:MAG: ferritin-like domain-containing protein [Myxococcota bacterium]
MSATEGLYALLPHPVRRQVDSWREAFTSLVGIRNAGVVRSLAPSAVRGLVLHRGKQGVPTRFSSDHEAYFDWSYPSDMPEMAELYRRAKQGQWDGEADLAWDTPVDPFDPDAALLPEHFVSFEALEERGVRLTEAERRDLLHSLTSWMLSQFLHGEQGALMAACQVTEAVEHFDGKYYGATQVMDEARHVEVFHRYLDTKLEKLYQVNDNLFVVIDALMTDRRWDMKFLGMQIMVEGLALGAFGTLYRMTREPLVKDLLRRVIQDEARHVHYGVLALRDHVREALDESQRREREDWAFEMAVLMRNRFMAAEVYEEWFGHALSWADWKRVLEASPGMEAFRHTMFSRLVPNLREIGLLTDRIRRHYERVGLAQYFEGHAAPEITPEGLIRELDT